MRDDSYDTLALQTDEQGIALCTFDRAEKRNALSRTMVRELRQVLERLAADPELKVLIFTGAGGKAFISGADIAELRERVRADAFRRINNSLFREIEQFPAPTIAAVRGYALGGGCELAISCDLRVAGEGAVFGQPEVGLGIIPGAGGAYRLPRLIGLGRARDLVFTGRFVDAQEALSMGLVNRVVPDAAVVDEARALAAQIARNSGLAVRLAKTMLNSAAEMSVDVGMALEATTQAVLFEDPEKNRRMTDFLDKRAQRRRERAAQREES